MKKLVGVPASPGIVMGVAYHVRRTRAEVVYQKILGGDQLAREQDRLERAVAAAEDELVALKGRVARDLPAQVYLIEAHLQILKDPKFSGAAKRLVAKENLNAEWAVATAAQQVAERFAKVDDPYIKSRVEDVEDVGERVLKALTGGGGDALSGLAHRAVLVAHSLSPADTTQLNPDRVMGFITEVGSRTSHTAIVAKALELPAVVGLEKALARIPSGSQVIVDGNRGEVIVEPDPETLAEYRERRRRYAAYVAQAQEAAHLPALTLDGRQVNVLANIEQPDEAAGALRHGAEGIGLFRTEFLYLNQPDLPGEEQLYASYRSAVETMAGRPVTIRTLDLGGDKFAHHLNLAPELNPAMGLRAVRFCLSRPEIFRTQLKAILRASAHGDVRVMFPMISGVPELVACRKMLGECLEELKAQGRPCQDDVKVGCMIEVPSAAIIADHLARHADFFSIGTNDLIQYSLAIDRANEYVAHMYQPFHPSVLRMVERVITAGRERGIQVAMCGEMAGDPVAVPILVGLGLNTISVNPQAVGRIKQVARVCSFAASRRLARKVITLESEDKIERYLNRQLSRFLPETFGPDGRMLY